MYLFLINVLRIGGRILQKLHASAGRRPFLRRFLSKPENSRRGVKPRRPGRFSVRVQTYRFEVDTWWYVRENERTCAIKKTTSLLIKTPHNVSVNHWHPTTSRSITDTPQRLCQSLTLHKVSVNHWHPTKSVSITDTPQRLYQSLTPHNVSVNHWHPTTSRSITDTPQRLGQ